MSTLIVPSVPNWSPFRVTEKGDRADPPRSIHTRDGIGDRLRAAAFAEIQAREAFYWAANGFEDAPAGLRTAWKGLGLAEDRHMNWLLNRLKEIEIEVTERKVSDHLWYSLIGCKNAREFAFYMASAEERGRRAGERFHQQMLEADPISAKIFGKIAEEEIEHIALTSRYYPDRPANCIYADSWNRVPHRGPEV